MNNLSLVIEILQIGLLVSGIIFTLEIVYTRNIFSSSGLLNWRFLQLDSRNKVEIIISNSLHFLQKPSIVVLVFVINILGLMVLVGLDKFDTPIVALIVLLTQVIVNYRMRPMHTGSFQMRTIICAGILVYYSTANMRIQELGILFIAFQTTMAYLLSGIQKLASRNWLNGNALIYALASTAHNRNLEMIHWFSHRPKLRRLACHAIILFECVGPLSVVLGPSGIYYFVCFGVLFHLGIAWLMGFNDFLFVFITSYAALIYSSYYFIEI